MRAAVLNASWTAAAVALGSFPPWTLIATRVLRLTMWVGAELKDREDIEHLDAESMVNGPSIAFVLGRASLDGMKGADREYMGRQDACRLPTKRHTLLSGLIMPDRSTLGMPRIACSRESHLEG